MNIDYATTIIKVRAKLNLSQTELSEMLGVSFASVNRWENGKNEPNRLVKEKIRLICEEKDILPVQIIPDYSLIKRVCDLSCTEEDVIRPQTTIKYDNEYPFKKYYSVKTIIGAINKYLTNEWSDRMLAHWACVYCWVLCGGFDKNLKEELNSFEQFLVDVLTWDLDGLSFFDESTIEEGRQGLECRINFYKDLDHIWKTREKWRCIYAMVGECAEFNGDQYVVLVNDATREYMIVYSDHLKNGYKDKYFKYVSEEALIESVAELEKKQYQLLSASEESFYSEISNN